MENTSLDIVIPVHNEAQTIEHTLNDLYAEVARKIPSRIIIAEDGSTDGTKEILRRLSVDLPLRLILSDKRKGYMNGVKDGLKQTSCETVFFIDSDGQYAPSDFWKLHAAMGKSDMVVGRKVKRRDSYHRIVLSYVFNQMLRLLFRVPIHDADTGLRLIRRKVIEDVLEDTIILPYSFWAEFTARASKKGYRIFEVPVEHLNRLAGGTRLYSARKLPKIILMQLAGLSRLFAELNIVPRKH
jgi:glycosyltransferase involved in cell wall biosynthesis